MTVGWETLDVGEQALVYNHEGEARIEEGPKRISVPIKSSRSSHTVDVLDGYKSDTDLLRQKQAAKTSSSERNSPWNKLFLQVSHEIISDWKNVGRHLEIREGNISIIDQNHHDVKEKAYSMLTKWQESKGHDATKEKLIKALEDCELKRVAEIVEEFDITPYVEDVTDLETDGVDDSSREELEMFDITPNIQDVNDLETDGVIPINKNGPTA
ncbi:unnamed protein product [Mytilus edulis]|uniref:Death domain-containing protein n=1 Tax=Mytilus edulis TaxID=6550 RepID=A0A8S3RMZ9_MYTED|nr:unnamed protein product [Mytilus edulis]